MWYNRYAKAKDKGDVKTRRTKFIAFRSGMHNNVIDIFMQRLLVEEGRNNL